MHYAPRRPSKDAYSKRKTRSRNNAPRTSIDQSDQTVGAYLQAKYAGAYSEAWMAGQLRCPEDIAAQLARYWLPQKPPHLIEQALRVFAKALDLDSQTLFALVNHESPMCEPDIARNVPASLEAPLPLATLLSRADTKADSAEDVPIVKRRQPTIIWRKTRKCPRHGP